MWKTVLLLFGVEAIEVTNYEKVCRTQSKNDSKHCSKESASVLYIFDEAHRCKSKNTGCNKFLQKIAASPSNKIMLLSATIADTPENFYIFGYVLKLYGAVAHGKKWLKELFEDDVKQLHASLFVSKKAVRMANSEGIRLFKNNIITNCYKMKNKEDIQAQYEKITELKEKIKETDDSLSLIMYCRMLIESYKIPTIIEITKEKIKEGFFVVIFVNFTDTLKTLSIELKSNCLIYGENTVGDRCKNIEDFNSNKERIIIVNIKSGSAGISLHDTIGEVGGEKSNRVSIISPSWSAQDIIQVLGRIYRSGIKSDATQILLYCKGTIEEKIASKMNEKIKYINGLNTGKEVALQATDEGLRPS